MNGMRLGYPSNNNNAKGKEMAEWDFTNARDLELLCVTWHPVGCLAVWEIGKQQLGFWSHQLILMFDIFPSD